MNESYNRFRKLLEERVSGKQECVIHEYSPEVREFLQDLKEFNEESRKRVILAR